MGGELTLAQNKLGYSLAGMSEPIVIARKSPWIVGAASLCAIAIALGFTLFSVHDGFDISSRSWAANRLWLWYAAAYLASPLMVIFVLAHFVNLARRGFVCIAAEGDCLTVVALPVRHISISALKAVEVKGGMLLLTLDSGKQVYIGRLGLVGDTKVVIERLRQLKPEIALLSGQS
jgi:hypothetical protein